MCCLLITHFILFHGVVQKKPGSCSPKIFPQLVAIAATPVGIVQKKLRIDFLGHKMRGTFPGP